MGFVFKFFKKINWSVKNERLPQKNQDFSSRLSEKDITIPIIGSFSVDKSMLKATIQRKYITIPIIGSSPVDKSVLTEPILVFVRHLQIKQ